MATSPLFGWQEPDDTNLVKDGAAAIRTLGNAIDSSMGDLLGGTTGQVLAKASNTNMDFTWVAQDDSNAIQNAIVDAKGDLIAASAADTPARLAVGANGTTLFADSTAATGLAWGSPKVIQVVQGQTSTNVTMSSSTPVDTGLTATITPKFSTSKVLVMVTQNGVYKSNGNAGNYVALNLQRNGGNIMNWYQGAFTNTAIENIAGSAAINYIDSPATTSATTYKTQIWNPNNTANVAVQVNGMVSTITLIEIGA